MDKDYILNYASKIENIYPSFCIDLIKHPRINDIQFSPDSNGMSCLDYLIKTNSLELIECILEEPRFEPLFSPSVH